jgi:hypothetical protein
MIERQRRRAILNGPILRINQYIAGVPEGTYSGLAAAYGYLFDGPWGALSGSKMVGDFGDEVLEHMIGEGGDFREILEAGGAALRDLNAKLPKQAAVTEAVGNSPTNPEPSISG